MPSTVSTWWGPSIGGPGTEVHGTACAEIVHDMAPGATLYLVDVGTSVELGNAVDWLVSQSVNVISHSVAWFNVGPGDGTGSVDSIVDNARAHGILWVNAAGNYAQAHWSGTWADGNADNWLDFTPTNEGNFISANAGDVIQGYLRWSDPWGASTNDYNLYLIQYSSSTIVAASTNVQNGSQNPDEYVYYTVPTSGYYFFAIQRYGVNASTSVKFDLFVPNVALQYQVAAGSIANPADSANALTVGAVAWNAPTTIEYYSSQGPTKDNRIKPDVVGPARVSTITYGSYASNDWGFAGTSAATPHVAGAAALVKQAYPGYTPAQVQSYLETHAVDLGVAGKDNVFGSGRVLLGGVPASSVLGQAAFSSNAPNRGGNAAANTLYYPASATLDASGNLWVADSQNSRVLRYAWPLSNGMAASLVLGQADFSAGSPNRGSAVAANTLYYPASVAVDVAGNVWVADSYNHRVLKYAWPQSNGMAASLVLGQASFTSNSPNRGGAVTANGLCYPVSVALDSSGDVWVADNGNNRVLRYGGPLSSGMPASVVLGQANFTSASWPQPAADTLAEPLAIAVDASGSLWVSDMGNSRVLKYAWPLSSGMSASLVLGQPDFASGSSNRGGLVAANTLNGPVGVSVDSSGNVWVADMGNNRVLKYAWPLSAGMSGSLALGQGSFASALYNQGDVAASDTLHFPTSVILDSSGNIWVADEGNNRVLEYALNPQVRSVMVSPTSGPRGTSVSVSGVGFVASSSMTLTRSGSQLAQTTTDANGSFSANLTATVPPFVGGVNSVTCTDGAGNVASAAFTLNPRIASITPSQATVGSAVNVGVQDFNAGDIIAANSITVGGIAGTNAATTLATGSGSIAFTLPPVLTPGNQTVVVTESTGARSASASFTVVARSVGVSPPSGTRGTSVTVSGLNFAASSSMTLTVSGVLVAQTTTDANGNFSATITATVPPFVGGSNVITGTDGTGNSANAVFTLGPRISGIQPGQALPGNTVNVSVQDFNAGDVIAANFITIGGVAGSNAATTLATGSGTIAFTLPATVTPGSQTVVVTENTGVRSASASFTVSSSIPCKFYGTVTVDGVAASDGTIVAASIDGAQVATATTSGGNYAINVPQADTGTNEGKTVSFTVAGHPVPQTGTWTQGGVLSLDLSATRIPGDVNWDGAVNSTDLTLVAASFGKHSTDPGFNPAADLNHDGIINVFDLVIVGLNYGRHP